MNDNDVKIQKQMFQMHQKGYSEMTKALKEANKMVLPDSVKQIEIKQVFNKC